MVSPLVIYGCESWTIKKAERQRIYALCWRRLLRVPWAARISNQPVLKEISPEYSLEGLMLKLKLQSFGPWCEELTHWKRPWCWKSLKAGRGQDGWMASLSQWIGAWANAGRWQRTGKPGVLPSMVLQRVGCNWANEQLPPLPFKQNQSI